MFIIYLIVVPVVYYWTEVRRLPEWLQFPPFHCRKCLTFWTLIGISLVIGLSFNWEYFMISGIILAIMTAIAMHVDQKNKTIKV
jgi:uncharacterized membrane protein